METKINRESMETDIMQTVLYVLQRIWIVLLSGAVLAASFLGYAWFGIAPTYSASTQFYVNNTYDGTSGFSSSQMAAALELANTYMVILQSRDVLNVVAERSGLHYSGEQLKGMISTASVNSTEVFEVTVTCTDYKHAAILANTISDVFPEALTSVVDVSSVRVVEYAIEEPDPVGPSYVSYFLIGGVAGVFLAVAVLVLIRRLDTTIRTEEYLAFAYERYPVLAVIPGAQNPKGSYYKGYYESQQKQPARKNGGARK